MIFRSHNNVIIRPECVMGISIVYLSELFGSGNTYAFTVVLKYSYEMTIRGTREAVTKDHSELSMAVAETTFK